VNKTFQIQIDAIRSAADDDIEKLNPSFCKRRLY
jgi:hypothetical protein